MTHARAGGNTIAAIEVVGIEKSFGDRVALRGVTLRLTSGITGVLGPNGAGKTTFLRVIATVLAPDRGHVQLLGRDPGHTKDVQEIRRNLGYLPQEPGLYRNFTAFDFVDYVAILKDFAGRSARRDEVLRVLELVGLTGVRDERIKALSGGMRRRLLLAQALLGDPDLLVLDEPTAGLDPEQRLRFRALVTQLPHRPVIVLSTHQTDDLMAMCERVVVLHGGEVRFDGTPDALTEIARGRVWTSPEPDSAALISWRTADGRFRHISQHPAASGHTEPTLDDGYLLLVGGIGRTVAAGGSAQ